MAKKTDYREDIQVLRGLAVLAVVLFHANEKYFPLGYLGVDVLFVISGFVVMPLIIRIFDGQNIGQRLSNLGSFYKARFFRLAPALATTLVISSLVLFLLGPPGDHERFARQGLATLLLLGNFGAYRYSGDYFSPNPNPLVHTWSLSVEEQIYILLPVALILIVLHRTEARRIVLKALIAMTVVSFTIFTFPEIFEPIYSKFSSHYNGVSFAFYSPVDRLWQFTIGGLGFIFLDQYKNRSSIFPRNVKIALISILAIILFGPTELTLSSSSIIATFVALLVIFSKSLDVLPSVLSIKLAWIGDRSYSIYLVHMPLIYIAKYSPVVKFGFTENHGIQIVIAVILSVYLGSLNYKTIENRFRVRGKEISAGLKPIWVMLVLTLVIPTTLFISMDKGYNNRYWGLMNGVLRPVYPAELDPNCVRASMAGLPCIYLSPGSTKNLLLIGDSHAGHISQAVVSVAKKQNWNAVIWVASNCRVNFTRSGEDIALNRCIKQNQRKLRWVEANKPDLIIISQFVQSNESQSHLRNALSTLKKNVSNLLLIENTPVFPDSSEFMIDRPLVMPPFNPPKDFPISAMQTEDEDASDDLAAWAKNNQISTMNFDSLFCSKRTCSRYSGGEWLFRDDSHLSQAGANLAIPQLNNFLKSLK